MKIPWIKISRGVRKLMNRILQESRVNKKIGHPTFSYSPSGAAADEEETKRLLKKRLAASFS